MRPWVEERRVGLGRLVDLVRRHLGFDAVLVAEMVGSGFVIRALAGAAEGVADDVGAELVATGGTSDAPALGRSGFSQSVTVRLEMSDGSFYGILSGLARGKQARPEALEGRFLSMLAELIAEELDEDRRLEGLRIGILDLIENAHIDTVYQPIVDLGSARTIGAEALSRFPAPFEQTDRTFAAAEEVGLALELERLAISNAWPMLQRLRSPQFLTINISPGALLTLAPRANDRPELSLSNLVVEITEHAMVERYDQLRDELAPLRERGLRVAIDDAGAGYASLQHIIELHPDFVKIDNALVFGVASDHARRVAIGALVLLSLDLGALVIAEGAETAGDLLTLHELGVHAAQGYLLGRPTGAEEISERLQAPASNKRRSSG